MKTEARFISAADTAATVERALELGDEAAAIRHLTEAVSRLIQASADSKIPQAILEAPDPIRDSRYETLIATAFAYAMSRRGEMPLAWMTDAKPVPTEWLWGGDGASKPFRDFIRSHTPDIFRDKNILTRERDWTTL
ncbi:hypothetical protein [Rhodoglobus vestalii]|nr:hypothetical protein [Rhodoglobus vestalii]